MPKPAAAYDSTMRMPRNLRKRAVFICSPVSGYMMAPKRQGLLGCVGDAVCDLSSSGGRRNDPQS